MSISTSSQADVSMTGLVSVIIPAYNAGATVERTISSVLNQTYSSIEVLVVDDGSTDNTAVLVQRMADADPRIKLLQKPNGGVALARNFGIAHAAGEFIAPLDADDLWHPEKIAKQITLIREAGQRIGFVYCWSREIDEQDRVLWDVPPYYFRGNVYAALIARNFVSSCAPLVRKRCVEEIGGYDPTLLRRGATGCEDLKFNLDVAERFEFDLVPEFLAAHRVRVKGMSTDLETMLRSYCMVLEAVRQRHPELPRGLFRMASGHQDREFGLSYIRKGSLENGAWLLLKALLRDPSSTIQVGAARLLARIWTWYRGNEDATRMAHRTAADRVLKHHFLEVNPTVFCERQIATLTRKRTAYLAKLCTSRSVTLGGRGNATAPPS